MRKSTTPVPVLLMARELGLGGTERQMTEIALSMDRSRFQPHVGCFRPEGIRGDELRTAGIPVAQFAVRSFYRPSAWTAARAMGLYLRRHNIDLVHTFDVPLNLFGVPTARAFRTPVVISSQRAYRQLTPWMFRPFLQLTDHLVDGVVVNCEAMRRHLVTDERVPAGLVHVCYNGIDTDKFQPMDRSRRVPALRGASLVVGIVCALRPEKGLFTLLRAFERVRDFRPGLRLAIVGSGPMRAALEQCSSELGIAGQCVFEPTTGHVADWLRSIDIFVLPSTSEALSNSLMEAMACECAPVASRVGGNPELIHDGQTGLLFDPDNPEQLAQCLRLLIENEDLRKETAARAARSISERFSLRAAADRMAEIYLGRLEAHQMATRNPAFVTSEGEGRAEFRTTPRFRWRRGH
jgi:glycosyltransferase involved in cell wall biosynthesis